MKTPKKKKKKYITIPN